MGINYCPHCFQSRGPSAVRERGGGAPWPHFNGERAANGNYIESDEVSKRHGICGDPEQVRLIDTYRLRGCVAGLCMVYAVRRPCFSSCEVGVLMCTYVRAVCSKILRPCGCETCVGCCCWAAFAGGLCCCYVQPATCIVLAAVLRASVRILQAVRDSIAQRFSILFAMVVVKSVYGSSPDFNLRSCEQDPILLFFSFSSTHLCCTGNRLRSTLPMLACVYVPGASAAAAVS